MSADAEWMKARIAEARKSHGYVTPAVVDRLEKLFNGQLSERQLPQAELASIAADLLKDMAVTSPAHAVAK